MSVETIIGLVPWIVVFGFGVLFYTSWRKERRFEREERYRTERLRIEAAHYAEAATSRENEQEKVRNEAGGGSGGYIVLDLPDEQRGLFHDLLKGFEEYAQLKGYSVSFSVDTTFHDRIAFKFTLTDSNVVVGTDRIRNDLKEYLSKVLEGGELEDLPQIISIEEHEVLVATLKNRISFLQHSYNLAKNSAEFYEALVKRVNTQTFLPSPHVVVQTGGEYRASNYSALNSPQAVLGNKNDVESTLHIAVTYHERKQQIAAIDDVLSRLKNESNEHDCYQAIRNLENAKEELEQEERPEPNRLRRWLEAAKQTMQAGSFAHETVQAAKELFRTFNV